MTHLNKSYLLGYIYAEFIFLDVLDSSSLRMISEEVVLYFVQLFFRISVLT